VSSSTMVFPVDTTAALLGVDADGPIAEVAKRCWVALGSPASARAASAAAHAANVAAAARRRELRELAAGF